MAKSFVMEVLPCCHVVSRDRFASVPIFVYRSSSRGPTNARAPTAEREAKASIVVLRLACRTLGSSPWLQRGRRRPCAVTTCFHGVRQCLLPVYCGVRQCLLPVQERLGPRLVRTNRTKLAILVAIVLPWMPTTRRQTSAGPGGCVLDWIVWEPSLKQKNGLSTRTGEQGLSLTRRVSNKRKY